MTDLDRSLVPFLEKVRGCSVNTGRIIDDAVRDRADGRHITQRKRQALYAIAWRFRKQIINAGGAKVMSKVVIELATTQADFENSREPPVQVARERTRVNPLDAVMKNQAEFELG
jgi:hypothetical protein